MSKIRGDEFMKEWRRYDDFKDLDVPRPIVLVNGVFDLLHSGHLYLIHQGRLATRIMGGKRGRPRQGTLVCAIDSDKLVTQKKGPGRPVLNSAERMTTLNYTPVDYIVEIDSDQEFQKLFKYLQPDVRVRGVQYKGTASRVQFSGKTIWVPALNTLSTTEIIRRCKEVE